MAVSEGRSLREALRKLGAAEPRRLRAQLGTGGGPAVRSSLEFARTLRRLGVVLAEDERRALLRKFSARDSSGLRGVRAAPLLERLAELSATPAKDARRVHTPKSTPKRRLSRTPDAARQGRGSGP